MQYYHHYKHLLDKLNQQRASGFLCDCSVVIGEIQFRAHRNVLVSFSEYFAAFYRYTTDNNVFLDQNQVKAEEFEKILEFIYTGDINLDSCNVKEIQQAANYLKVDDLVSKCKIKMESCDVIANPSPTEVSELREQFDLTPQSCFLEFGDQNIEEKSDNLCTDVLRLQPKRMMWRKKTSLTRKRKKHFAIPKKVQSKNNHLHQNDILKKTTVEMLDSSKLATEITNQTGQRNDDLELQFASAFESETFLTQDITIHPVKHRLAKPQSCALKEHYLTNIESVKNVYDLEGPEKDLDENYLKTKPVCNTCGKVFSEASSLRRHMRIHKGVKPYECHLCGKAFTQCNQLKTHVRTHTGEKPYQCDLCDKGFAQKCQLVFHSRMHHGEEKPYKCDACNLQFATSSNLKIHARKHSGEKPYVCERCGQRFAQASTLTYHVRRHTGEKPYICDTCGKTFAVSSSLITHKRKHTGERPFVCELCGNSYTDVKNLKKHKSKIHSGSEKNTEANTVDTSFNEEESVLKSPLPDATDLKPCDLSCPLGSEDHQMLLPVTDSQSPTQSPSSEALLRSSVSGYSEPQFIFLQQLY
ncbi:myoneurin isoform X2 [Ambystoma mexicanum]|uniref:myoneurin isoform X2 n=1 Tax=Ambystoma mexicanum TaxID=8296 RepID=UPI0037E8BBF1